MSNPAQVPTAPSLLCGKRVHLIVPATYQGFMFGSADPAPSVMSRALRTNISHILHEVWRDHATGQVAVTLEDVIYHPLATPQALAEALIADVPQTEGERVIVIILKMGDQEAFITELVERLLQRNLPRTTFCCAYLMPPERISAFQISPLTPNRLLVSTEAEFADPVAASKFMTRLPRMLPAV